MNYLVFSCHIFAISLFILLASRMGRGALVSMSALGAVIANLFVIKQVSLFGATITCADAYSVGAIIAMNLCQSKYGKDAGKEMVRIAFFCLAFFGVMTQIHLTYQPAAEDWTHNAFKTILETSPRIVFASITSFVVSSRIDVEWFAFLRKRLPLLAATMISVACTQTLDTFLFSVLGLWGLVSSLLNIFLISLAAKLVAIAMMGLITVRRHAV
ncbi:MAG: queuosine precursor transporter [Simkaniaceae bacterium]|nr:queuosine precursor transporter [Simkaniaceae bacterium]